MSLVPLVECLGTPSRRLLQGLAPFGLGARAVTHMPPPSPDHDDMRKVLGLPGRSIALLTGPSGCGKSTLLRAVGIRAQRRGTRVLDATTLLHNAPADRPLIDLLTVPLERALRTLALAGLAEPKLWARCACQLSDGQRARLGIALAMSGATCDQRALVLLDEFGTGLDQHNAWGIARTVRRWASRQPNAVVCCATTRADIAPALAPDLKIIPKVTHTE